MEFSKNIINLKRKISYSTNETVNKKFKQTINNADTNTAFHQNQISNIFNNIIIENKNISELKMKFNKFLLDLNLSEINVNADGLCFISSIRLYFQHYHQITYTIETIHNKIIEFFTINKIHLIGIDQNTPYEQNLTNQVKNYLVHKNYDNELVDEIITNSANIFNIKIFIIEVRNEIHTGNIYYFNPNTNLFDTAYIVVSRHVCKNLNKEFSHFNLLSVDRNLNFYIEYKTQTFKKKINYNPPDLILDDYSEDSLESSIEDDSDYSVSFEKSKCNCFIFKNSFKYKSCPVHTNKNKNSKHKNAKENKFFNLARSDNFQEIYCNDSDSVNCRHYLGSLDVTCYNCNALLFKQENTSNKTKPCSNVCCSDGKILLPYKKDPPKLIKHLLTSNDNISQEFRLNIRAYNQCLSFTSLGVNLDLRYANNKKGHYNYRIHGTTYHRIGSLLPHDNIPKFLQLYTFDTDFELENRSKIFPSLNKSLLLKLQNLMHKHNPYVKKFKQVAIESKTLPELKIVLKADSSIDQRTHNKPNSSEVAILLPGN